MRNISGMLRHSLPSQFHVVPRVGEYSPALASDTHSVQQFVSSSTIRPPVIFFRFFAGHGLRRHRFHNRAATCATGTPGRHPGTIDIRHTHTHTHSAFPLASELSLSVHRVCDGEVGRYARSHSVLAPDDRLFVTQ